MIAADGLPMQLACRVLNVSESGYYARRSRAPSARAIRHVWLTDVIREVHIASRGTYGIRRVHADLILGQGIAVGHLAVEMLMRRAGIPGVSGRPRFRHIPGVASPANWIGAVATRISGVPELSEVGTSHVERQNLTMRKGMRRFTRLTNAFSRKVENLAAAVSLHFMYYNFARPHMSLANPTHGRPPWPLASAITSGRSRRSSPY